MQADDRRPVPSFIPFPHFADSLRSFKARLDLALLVISARKYTSLHRHRSLIEETMNIARIVFAAWLCAAPCWAQGVNIVQNQGLELGTLDWHISNIIIGRNATWAHTGLGAARSSCAGVACIDALGQGSFISQVLPTTYGEQYELSFWVRNTSSVGEFSVFWDGVMIADQLSPTGPMLNYSYRGLAASGSAALLEIHGRADGAVISFDDIVVQQAGMVPEPLSYVMLFAGLGVLALAMRRRPRWASGLD
jgi:hypothetical protein